MADQIIREDNVLEFKALVMTKKVFDQLRDVESSEIDLAPKMIIGWVRSEVNEWFVINHPQGGLARVPRFDTRWFMVQQAGGEKEFLKLTRPALATDGIGKTPAQLYSGFRDSLRQIFVK